MGPFEFIYYLGYRLKRAHSLKRQGRLPRTVISIGNITTGGTGKTPAVIALAEEAQKRGFSPCILTRGYKGKAKGPCFVSKGDGPLMTAEDAGDEPALMAEKLTGVPIVKGKDRYEAGLFAIKNLDGPSLFILDDGFQHWRLWRDKDILLINGKDPFGEGKLLPVGRLREPVKEIKRAGIIVITKSGHSDEALLAEIRRHNPHAPIFKAGHEPSSLKRASGGEFPLDMLSGMKVYAFSGIGDPESFRNTLVSSGANIRGFRPFRDHYAFKCRDIGRLSERAGRAGAEWIITTEKDIIRLRGCSLPENLLILGVEFTVGECFYDEVFKGGMEV